MSTQIGTLLTSLYGTLPSRRLLAEAVGRGVRVEIGDRIKAEYRR